LHVRFLAPEAAPRLAPASRTGELEILVTFDFATFDFTTFKPGLR
jgi:hypothetical protein